MAALYKIGPLSPKVRLGGVMRSRELLAEGLGAFGLVLGLCGAQLVAGTGTPVTPALGAGLVYVALATTIGPLSGAHYNPAVTLGAIAAGRFDSSRLAGYVVAQCIGALLAIGLLAMLAGQSARHSAGLAGLANRYAGSFGLTGVLLIETVVTALLVVVFVGSGGRRSSVSSGPLAVGCAIAVGYLLAIPISGGGLNPARSLAASVVGGGEAIAALWAFWVAPILGAVLGGLLARYLTDEG